MTRQPVPVLAVVTGSRATIGEELQESQTWMDDAYWLRFSRRPVTPQGFINWWIARRWVIPRDITKE
jgi:hypothetical protein